jgi:ribonuclease VapC
VNSVVLDASAILAVLLGERGHEVVVPQIKGSLISAVNYSEVLKKATERGSTLLPTRLYLENLTMVVVPFDERQAVQAAELWPASREHGLSFADRACLALGMARGVPVVTADRRLAETGLSVEVQLIR